jgi:putative nucleotidyltransferase with HDIG domain
MRTRTGGRPEHRALPWRARLCVATAVAAAALCAAPYLLWPTPAGWAVLLPLAGFHLLCEGAPRLPLLRGRLPRNAAASLPVLLTAVLLLPPAGAALTPVAGALLGQTADGHPAARRLWHAGRAALAACAAAWVRLLLLGPHTPEAGGADLAAAVPAACAAALSLGAVSVLLDGLMLVAAEGRAPHTVRRGGLAAGALVHLVHGLTALMAAVLWRSPYGPAATALLLLPLCVSGRFLDRYHRERTEHQATIRALVQAVDLKDRYTRGHSERVGRASVLIARELGLGEERTELLRFAGILHDVGKLGVPTRVLRKDGPLTPEERRIIELHPEYGHEMVRGIGFLEEARSAILHHHERLDGSGYPYGLAGEAIPEPARVVAVADAFDAMTSTRSYRRARPVAAAVAELQRCAGTQFDARMVEALAGALEREGWSPASTADEPGDSAHAHLPAARRRLAADLSAADHVARSTWTGPSA